MKSLNLQNNMTPSGFHTDKNEAKKSNFKGIIASGIHVAALWRLLDHEINSDINFVCGIGWDNVRWKNPLRPNNAAVVSWHFLCDIMIMILFIIKGKCHENYIRPHYKSIITNSFTYND